MPNPIWHLVPGVLHVFPALGVQFVPADGAPGAQGQATTPPVVPLKHSAPAGTGVGPPTGTLVVSQSHARRTPTPTANKTKTPTAAAITKRLLVLVALSFIGSPSLAIAAMEHSLQRIVDSAFQLFRGRCPQNFWLFRMADADRLQPNGAAIIRHLGKGSDPCKYL